MWRTRFVLILFLSLQLPHSTSAAVCHDPPTTPTTIQGIHPASRCRFPFLVSLRHSFWKTHECSGTLIKPEYVLTSATCADRIGGSGLAYINGYHRKGPFEETKIVESVIIHPKRTTESIAYDVALLKLSNASSQPTIRLADTAGTPSRGRVTLFGWGRVAPHGAYSEVMQTNTKLKVSPSTCKTLQTGEGIVCAGTPGSDLCEGDMGGPLIKNGRVASKDIQIGIVSKLVGDCATNKQPGLFTEVASIISWIQQST